MPEDDRTDVRETYEKDIQFLANLENSMMEVRRLLNAAVRDLQSIDEMTLNETMSRAHTAIVSDIYYRVQALAERRGQKENFEYDIALQIHDAGKLDPESSEYHSRLIELYFRLLARYQFWMDQLGILLTNAPFDPNFAQDLIEAMQTEFRVEQRKRREREKVDEETAKLRALDKGIAELGGKSILDDEFFGDDAEGEVTENDGG